MEADVGALGPAGPAETGRERQQLQASGGGRARTTTSVQGAADGEMSRWMADPDPPLFPAFMTDADVALVSGVLSGLFNIRLPEYMARAKQHCIRHRAAVQEMLAYLATRDVEVRAGGRAAHSHTELRRSGRSWSEAQQLTAAAGDALAQLRMALRAIMLPRLEALLEATGVRLGEPECGQLGACGYCCAHCPLEERRGTIPHRSATKRAGAMQKLQMRMARGGKAAPAAAAGRQPQVAQSAVSQASAAQGAQASQPEQTLAAAQQAQALAVSQHAQALAAAQQAQGPSLPMEFFSPWWHPAPPVGRRPAGPGQ
eukprot:scaffold9.g3312.t1